MRRVVFALIALGSASAAWSACAIYDTSLLVPAGAEGGTEADATFDADDGAPPPDAPAEDGCAPGFARCGSGACNVQLEVDPKNCAACGHDCRGAPCLNALCQPTLVASGQNGPAYVAVADGVVYWTNATAGTVMRANADGTGRAQLAGGLASPWVIKVANGRVYVGDDVTGGALTAMDLDGGNAANLTGPQGSPRGISVTSTQVFFGTEDPDAGAIQRVTVDGTGLTVLVAPVSGPKDLVTDGVNVYFAALGDRHIGKVPVGGGASAVVANASAPFGLTVFGSNLFYTNRAALDAGGAIGRVGTDGTGQIVLAPAEDLPRSIAVDGNFAYWTNEGDGTVKRVPVTGGAVTTLATGQIQPWGIALDDGFVYWAAKGAGLVLRVAK